MIGEGFSPLAALAVWLLCYAVVLGGTGIIQADYRASTWVRGSASFLWRAFDNGVVSNVVRNMK